MTGAPPERLFDPALPQLAEALDPQAMAPRLAALLGGPVRLRAIEVVKHKPGRRAALCYTLEDDGGATHLFAKLFYNERGARIAAQMEHVSRGLAASTAQAAHGDGPAGEGNLGADRAGAESAPAGDTGPGCDGPSSDLSVPRVLGYLPDLRLLVTEWIAGVSLADAVLHGSVAEAAAAAAAMGRAAAALHRIDPAGLTRWGVADEAAATTRQLATLALERPDLVPWATARMRELFGALSAASPTTRITAIHRDLYLDQFLDAGGRTVLVDLDDVRAGDPALDLGNFVAHLRLRALQTGAVAGCVAARRAFLDACAEAAPPSALDRILIHESISLVRLAGVYAGRARWSRLLPEQLLDSSEQSFVEGRAGES